MSSCLRAWIGRTHSWGVSNPGVNPNAREGRPWDAPLRDWAVTGWLRSHASRLGCAVDQQGHYGTNDRTNDAGRAQCQLAGEDQ